MRAICTWIYRAALWLYPRDYRSEYAAPMMQLYLDMYRDTHENNGAPAALFWTVRACVDAIRCAAAERLSFYGDHTMTTMMIDNYRVKKEIGRGAAAGIYLAHDSEYERDVVIKLWAPEEGLDPDTLKRESEAMARLHRPGLPEVYDFVENDSQPYIVMEHILGENLLDKITRSEDFIPETSIVDWAVQLADILHHFHQCQPEPFVYRDMKPANVIIGEVGAVNLVDFGIAAPYAPGRKYNLIGTVGYAAPEQYRGAVDPRSDIYALGATLHHTATRFDPRPEHNPLARKHVFGPPRLDNPAISKRFAAVIMKALAFEPEDRFQSAAEMLQALADCRA